MSLIYDNKTVSHLQNLLNKGQVQITSIESYDTLLTGNRIVLGDVWVSFIKSNNPKIPGYLATSYMGENASREYMKEWKKYPISTHLVKDMRKLTLDNDDKVPYKEMIYTDANGIEKRALVRHLFEIENMDADQPECVEYYEKYCDFIHLEQCYLIIKIVDNDSFGYMQKEDIKVANSTVINDFGTTITPIVESSDVASSAEYFDNALF